MKARGDWDENEDYETARSGTLYWTLSLYIDPDRVAAAAGQPGKPLRHDQFGAVQRAHPPSLALRNAIDPLFNDIADREVLGEVQEHLLAAANAPETPRDDHEAGRKAAEATIRSSEKLTFHPPASIEWTTEGTRYSAQPPDLNAPRRVRFRRFWLAHNNGGLSYHLGFTHHYGSLRKDGDAAGYDPATYYFLSLLQKLAAPKEFELGPRIKAGTTASVFEPELGIAPLDKLTVTDAGGETERFWPFVKRRMIDDAERLFDRLENVTGTRRDPDLASHLIDQVPFIEVPGLLVPKSRFMFLLHDDRFFRRLMPLDPASGDAAARKLMVQDDCYQPYQDRLAKEAKKAPAEGPVKLDAAFWRWVKARNDYRQLIKGPHPQLRAIGGERFETTADLTQAIPTNGAEWVEYEKKAGETKEISATRIRIPAFDANRRDCLDYLFLAGFNQNIIDFMNQDTSEILDSIDPIYPDSDEQSDERFFVRYANHRAMISYVPKSRSLETGNDYIGTCPYAFLIHAMSLHNEFLAREHEAKSMARIERIEWHVAKGQRRQAAPLGPLAATLRDREPLTGRGHFDKAEMAINQAKLADYKDYERFRYANPFRYDTERDVFAKLEELRGTKRKTDALALAVASLEDHASDLQRRHQASSDRTLNILLGGTGIFGAGQMMYWIGDDAAKTKLKQDWEKTRLENEVAPTHGKSGDTPQTAPDSEEPARDATVELGFLGMPDKILDGEKIVDITTGVMVYALIFFIPFFFLFFGSAILGWLRALPWRTAIRAVRARPSGKHPRS